MPEVAGGREPGDTPAPVEIGGDAGHLRLGDGAARSVQSARLLWSLNGEPQPVDEGESAGLAESATNVGGVYPTLRRDIVEGIRTVTDFGYAVELTRLIETLFASSEQG